VVFSIRHTTTKVRLTYLNISHSQQIMYFCQLYIFANCRSSRRRRGAKHGNGARKFLS
jgi:hypothetical protein